MGKLLLLKTGNKEFNILHRLISMSSPSRKMCLLLLASWGSKTDVVLTTSCKETAWLLVPSLSFSSPLQRPFQTFKPALPCRQSLEGLCLCYVYSDLSPLAIKELVLFLHALPQYLWQLDAIFVSAEEISSARLLQIHGDVRSISAQTTVP